MKPLIKYTLLTLVVFLPALVSGQQNLSLSDALNKALQQNYTIHIVKRSQEVAETNNTWGAAGRFPTVNFSLSSNNRADFNEDRDYVMNGVTPGLSVNWLLFDGFAIIITKDKLETLENLSQGHTSIVIEQTIHSVIQAYYRAVLEKEKLAVVKEVMDLSRDRYDYTLMQKEIGSAVTYDVLQAQNAWLEDKAGFMQQEVTFRNAVRDLDFLMGVEGEQTYTCTEEFVAPRNEYVLETLKSKMLKSNKTLKNQYLNLMLREKEIQLAKSMYFPVLSLRSGIESVTTRMNYEGLPASTKQSYDLYANLALTFNFFDGGAKKRALRIAQIQEDAGQIEIEEMKHSLTNELGKLYDLYQVRNDLYNVTEENLDAAHLNMEISGDRFHAGTINSFNYRDVQLIYLNAATNKLNAVYNLIDTDTALMRITGGIITEN